MFRCSPSDSCLCTCWWMTSSLWMHYSVVQNGSFVPGWLLLLPAAYGSIVQYDGLSPGHRFISANELFHSLRCLTHLLCEKPPSLFFVSSSVALRNEQVTSAELPLVQSFNTEHLLYDFVFNYKTTTIKLVTSSSDILQVYLSSVHWFCLVIKHTRYLSTLSVSQINILNNINSV